MATLIQCRGAGKLTVGASPIGASAYGNPALPRFTAVTASYHYAQGMTHVRRGFSIIRNYAAGGRNSERARIAWCGGVMGTGFIKHKPKKSDAKRAERRMPKPKAKPAPVDKAKSASKPPTGKS